MNDLNPEAWAVKLAGLVGAVVSMQFLQGSWLARVNLALSGAAISYFAAPYLSVKIGLPEGLAGFLLGLFGMAVASRVWEWIQTTPVGELWQLLLAKLGKGEKS